MRYGGVGFEVHGEGAWGKITNRVVRFQLISRANKKIAKLTTGVVDCPASFFAC